MEGEPPARVLGADKKLWPFLTKFQLQFNYSFFLHLEVPEGI